MSLKNKLEQIKKEKENKKIEEQRKSVQEQIEDLSNSIADLKNKKEKIGNLREQLQNYYSQAQESLDQFKESKGEIQDIYEENKDMLKQEGIENRTEMLENNADEEEVIDYNTKKQGLKKEVGIINSIKDELKELNLNLSFSAKNREESFSKLEEEEKKLKEEIAKKEEEKERLLIEIPKTEKEQVEEVRDIFKKEKVLDRVSLDNIENFSISYKLTELKQGKEITKEVLQQEVYHKLENDKFYSKNEKEQEAIKHFDKLKHIVEIPDLTYKFNEVFQLRLKAINKIAERLDKDEEGSVLVSEYGIKGTNVKEQAEQYLKFFTDFSHLNRDNFVNFQEAYKNFQNNINNRNFSNQYSLEYFQQGLNNYEKIFQYIIDHVDKEKKLVPKKRYDEGVFINKFSNQKDWEEVGLIELKEKDKIFKYPYSYLNQFKSFEEAYDETQKVYQQWEEEKKTIQEISEKTIDLAWESAETSANFNRYKNEFDKIDKTREKVIFLNNAIQQLKNIFAKDNEKLVTVYQDRGFHDYHLQDVKLEDKGKELDNQKDTIKLEIEDYLNELEKDLEEKIQKIGTGIFSNKKKRLQLEDKLSVLKTINVSSNFEFNNKQKEVLEEEQLNKLEKLFKKFHELDVKREKTWSEINTFENKGKDIPFEHVISSDILNQTWKVKELISILQQEYNENKKYLDNLSPELKEVLAKKDKDFNETEKVEAQKQIIIKLKRKLKK